MFQWRRFQFFDKTLIKGTKEGEREEPHPLFQQLSVTCCTSGRGNLIIGDASGCIYLVPRDFEAKAFQAYNRTTRLLQQLKNVNAVVSLGADDDAQLSNVLRVWNLDKDDKSGRPLCLKAIPITNKSPSTPVTCFTAREDLSMLAVGFADGSVVLVYNDVVRSPKQRQIRSADDVPVTGLGWREAGSASALFVVTTSTVSVFPVDTFREETLDHHGCALGCALMSEEGDLVVGRPEAIYFYSPEGRGPCLAFEGDKERLAWFRNNLIVVGAGGAMLKNLNALNIYDMKNKFNAFSGAFENVSHVLTEWGTIFVLTHDRKAFQLEEKDTQTKLDSLFKKNFYQVAINLAQSQQYDYNSIVDIYRKFGDHLYGKGNFDGAITQYVKTIGGLEPSYVIRKFLDAQRIHNLTSYLQALHEQNRANPDHTTLLLNCYTKLKDVNKLDEFIKADSGYKFDVETAIKVCRQAHYFDHALFLARVHVRHEWYLKILLEDTKDYMKALDYISTLSLFEAEQNMKHYGKAMMGALPEKTTTFLKSLCSFYVPKKSSEFSHGGAAQAKELSSILEDLSFMEAAESADTVKARPENFIHIFVNQEQWLLDFLEYIVSQNEAGTSPAVYNTLLELYMQDDAIVNADYEQQKRLRQENLAKAMALLTNDKAVFDEEQALVLCKNLGFKQGILFLFEKQQMYNEIIQYHMEHKEYAELIRACKKFGNSDANLWIQTLSYFATNGEQCQAEIVEVLQHIDKSNMLPPLLVLQILSQNASTTLSVVKDYIVRLLEQDRQQIEEEQRHINEFAEETDAMKEDIEELRTSARVFQDNKCTVCSTPLDLPAVHFLCMHSYHLRCMGENERECPMCAAENNKILKIKKSLEANVNQHEQFFQQLESSPDGFATAAEYFGRGIFSPARPAQA